MAEQIKIKSGKLSALINFRGAELASFFDGEREVIWQGDERFWTSHAPVLFPVCGGLKDDAYYFNGKKYNMIKHGYVRKVDFSLFESSENSATFVLFDDKNSKEIYPFEFKLFIKYTLSDHLEVEYKVQNEGKTDMYFTIGAHEGFALDDEFSNYSVTFEVEEDLKALTLYGSLIGDEYTDMGKVKELKLSYDYFAIDALVFKDIKSKALTLKHKDKGEVMRICSDDNFKHLLLWTKPNAPYICIEPWVALPDRVDSNQNIEQKPDVVKLAAGESKSFIHTIKGR